MNREKIKADFRAYLNVARESAYFFESFDSHYDITITKEVHPNVDISDIEIKQNTTQRNRLRSLFHLHQ